jgi:hypothetical protein
LHCQPGGESGHVVRVRGVRIELLHDAKGSQTHREQEELREVRSDEIAPCNPAKQCGGRGEPIYLGSFEVGQFVEVDERCRGDWLLTISEKGMSRAIAIQ